MPTYNYDWPSNFSVGQNVSDITSLIGYSNYLSNGSFGFLVLIALYAIPFLSLKTQSAEKAFVASAFIALIGAGFMMAFDIISFGVFVICGIIFLLAVLAARYESNKGF